VLAEEAKLSMKQAWGIELFNVYAATETGIIAAECIHHRLHVMEDFGLLEVVDDHDLPVHDGQEGDHVLAQCFGGAPSHSSVTV